MERPYKQAMSLQAARAYLEEKREREFDPACVDAFLSRWDEVVEICTAQKVSLAPSVQTGKPTATTSIHQIQSHTAGDANVADVQTTENPQVRPD
jgi:HD-GYP domain-containing protein (c-di-GMP phosphodiesterase class II)